MPRQLILAWVWTLMFITAPAINAAVIAWTAVAVRVYDASGLAPGHTREALAVAGAALAGASVEIAWTSCSGPSGQGERCQAVRPGALAIRIVRASAATARHGRQPLGDAFVDTATSRGVLATVYVDRVEWLAGTAHVDPKTLLGHAIAHEIGHLLMGTTGHSARGLMRAVWSRDEISRRRARDWTFSTVDVAAIHAHSVRGWEIRSDGRGDAALHVE